MTPDTLDLDGLTNTAKAATPSAKQAAWDAFYDAFNPQVALALLAELREAKASLKQLMDDYYRMNSMHEAAESALSEAQARLVVVEGALKLAFPLAEIAMEDHRLKRLSHGHSDIGTIKVGLWDSEVDDMEAARAACYPKPALPPHEKGEA